ncbi:MAG: plasmid replication protein RepC [Paracoccaceae bacterium]
MEYTPISPFGRQISHVHLRAFQRPATSVSDKPVNKWEVFRDLSKAQVAFGISERDLTVVQGLLSFYPDNSLGGTAEMIVFPSNKALCERLNGMPCSTMRRHLARLVDAGLLVRRDSPNGKRYMRKHGEERVAFGFDLSPMYCRATEIAHAAEAVREAEDRVRRLREIVSLMRRDLAALAEFGEDMQPGLGLWDELRDAVALITRASRRKLRLDELVHQRDQLKPLLDRARSVIDGPDTENMIASDAHFEHHLLNSDIESTDFEPPIEKQETPTGVTDDPQPSTADCADEPDLRRLPPVPLHLVVTGCPTLKTFYQSDIRHWHQLFAAACHVRPAMGISASAWEEAQRWMGPEQASVVVAAMLERFAEIKSPGGYLRALTAKAAAGAFSCGPMVMALLGRRATA